MARPTILDRFRPVGAPGPSGPAGVPSTDQEGPGAELLPVFAALQPDTDEGRARVEAAASQARKLIADAHGQADAEVAQARLDAGAVRARAAEEVTQQAAAADAELLARARNRADQLGQAAQERLPELAAKIAGSIFRDYLGGGPP
ncbi:hypothetical protein ITX31_12680 [Arthrobacter gandavensis]|uniref:hypothetical protein n=1 Tax=Arthrobacter gandavensis TaxID=169960 RepID=UPI00188EBD01|nr:hypothetical protein [Arthrobacter gandavensis]MBF4994965.1 hypothetical protein [Arthrobacter gandavensis]